MSFHPWFTCSVGIFFCVSGIYLFFRNIFEENKTVGGSIFIMIMGVILISIASFQLFYSGHS